MENTASITAKMAAFGRAFYAENAANPVFADAKGKELIGEEEYRAMEAWIRQGVDFFCPEKTGRMRPPCCGRSCTARLRPFRFPAGNSARTA